MKTVSEAGLIKNACDPHYVSSLLSDGEDLVPAVRGLTVQAAKVIRVKPGKRCMIKYSGTDKCGSSVEFLGKIRFKGLDRRSVAIQRRLSTLFLDGVSDFSKASVTVPFVYGTLPRLNMWLQEFVEQGVPLSVQSVDFIAIQPRVAHALARLHQTRLVELEHHTIDDELSILNRRFQQLGQSHPNLEWHIQSLKEKVQSVSNNLRSCSLRTTIHRDFYFDQILLTDSQAVLVDLDLCCFGPPELDVGNYIGHLREYAIRFSKYADVCKHAEAAFFEAYLKHMPQSDQHSVQAWTTLTLVRHVSLSTLLPGRSHTTLALVDVAMDS